MTVVVCAMADSSAEGGDVMTTVEGIQSVYSKLVVREVFKRIVVNWCTKPKFIATETIKVMFAAFFKPMYGDGSSYDTICVVPVCNHLSIIC